jgi:GNAT superfamily N-acetyltransferase
MITIREYRETDAPSVGRLIADTYGNVNLGFASPEEKERLLGPFRHARSPDPDHQMAIVHALRTSMVFVAEEDGDIVGVLRGRKDRLQSLFVREDHHRQGMGRRLVQRFEAECMRQGGRVVRVASTLYAIPFYTAMGYKKTTGLRAGWSFGGTGLRYQPMKKVFAEKSI